MKLWIGNIAPETPDDEIRELVRKYAPDLECSAIQRVDGMYWKNRALFVQTIIR